MKTFAAPLARARVAEFLDTLGHALAAELGTALERPLHTDLGPVEDLHGAQIHSILPETAIAWSLDLDGVPGTMWCVLRRSDPTDHDAAALAAASERAATRLLRPKGRGNRSARAGTPAALDGNARRQRFATRSAHVGRRMWIRSPDELGLELLAFLPVETAEALSRTWVSVPTEFRDQSTGPAPRAGSAGELHRFVHAPRLAELIDRAAARAGLAVLGHGPADAPNPVAIPDGVVVLDVPVGQERRVEWCARLKHRRPRLAVVMLMHHPSRARVLRGLVAHPDLLLGLPIDEATLAERLGGLVSLPRTHA